MSDKKPLKIQKKVDIRTGIITPPPVRRPKPNNPKPKGHEE